MCVCVFYVHRIETECVCFMCIKERQDLCVFYVCRRETECVYVLWCVCVCVYVLSLTDSFSVLCGDILSTFTLLLLLLLSKHA